jgi:hypothetical protein
MMSRNQNAFNKLINLMIYNSLVLNKIIKQLKMMNNQLRITSNYKKSEKKSSP